METEFCPRCKNLTDTESKHICTTCGNKTTETGKFAVWFRDRDRIDDKWSKVPQLFISLQAAKVKRTSLIDVGCQAVITVW